MPKPGATVFDGRVRAAISDADVVSFDVFETLIWRIYERPTDLFHHIEAAHGLRGFARLRADGEQAARTEARAEGRHEVTLDEIYRFLPAGLAAAKDIEIAIELDCCHRDPTMHGAYMHARALGKPIVFASDMYLPRPVILQILERAGYGHHDQFFLSSLTGRPKATGAMFEDIVAWSRVAPGRILHIGDNYVGDVLMPRSRGLQALHYVPALEVSGAVQEGALFERLDTAPYAGSPVTSLLKGLTAHRNAAHGGGDYWEKLGFACAGPIAHSFVTWIKDRLDALGIERVYFMARDGYVFEQVFRRLYPGQPTGYVHASRRCYLLAALRQVDAKFLAHVADDTVLHGHTAYWSYADFYNQLGLDAPELHGAYEAEFPDQDGPVQTREGLDAVRAFFRRHERDLLAAGRAERDVLLDYFDSIGLFEGRCALVDLGWKGSLFEALVQICKLGGRDLDAAGLYFATHRAGAAHPRIETCALDWGEPADSILNDSRAVVLLETMFSAPHASILKVARTVQGFAPVYQDAGTDEAERLHRLAAIQRGIMAFVDAYSAATRAAPMPIPGPLSVGPLHALCLAPGAADRAQLARVTYTRGIGNVQRQEPLLPRTDHPMRFGIATPWPGTECAEYEVVARLLRAAENIGADPVLISGSGVVLTRKQHPTAEVVDARSLRFVVSVHYYIGKALDCFSYLTLWNPPEIPANVAEYPLMAEHYISYDDYLTAHSPRIENHLRTLLTNSPRDLDGLSELLTSFPESALMAPNLSEPTLFYCGMNWEKVVHRSGGARHDSLLKLLDDAGRIKFFGPREVKEWGGIQPWEGFANYQGPIPFDGFSILREINRCGVVLVVSSDDHRRSGMVTTRLYEACAAGAVIISDDNPFVQEHFKDAALFVDFNIGDPADTFRQIMDRFGWITANPEAALALANRAQAIFRERFTLERQLRAIFERQPAREAAAARMLHARSPGTVLVSYVVEDLAFGQGAKQKLRRVLDNAGRQVGARIVLHLACDLRVEAPVRSFVEHTGYPGEAMVTGLDLFSRTGSRMVTDGVAHRGAMQAVGHDFVMFAGPGEDWFRDHVTSLLRVLEDRPDAIAAHAGTTTEQADNARTWRRFAPLQLDALLACEGVQPGEALFRREVEDLVGDHTYEFIDGLEHYLFLLAAELKSGRPTLFSKRQTLAVAEHLPGRAPPMFKRHMQAAVLRDMMHYEAEARRAVSVGPHLGSRVPHAESDVTLQLRADLLQRTTELVQTRAAMKERLDLVSELERHIAVRDEHLAEVRQILIERTEQAETLLRDLNLRTAELEALRGPTKETPCQVVETGPHGP